MTATNHFRRRVAERVGPDVDPVLLAERIVADIHNGVAEFIGRISRDGKRLFRVRVTGHGLFYAMVNTRTMSCITIMPPGFRPPRQGGGFIELRGDDL